MITVRVFGTFRPRLNFAPLLLVPGIALFGYAIDGGTGAWSAVAAWLALVIGAMVSCAVHALLVGQEKLPHAGRRAFDYDGNKARH